MALWTGPEQHITGRRRASVKVLEVGTEGVGGTQLAVEAAKVQASLAAVAPGLELLVVSEDAAVAQRVRVALNSQRVVLLRTARAGQEGCFGATFRAHLQNATPATFDGTVWGGRGTSSARVRQGVEWVVSQGSVAEWLTQAPGH